MSDDSSVKTFRLARMSALIATLTLLLLALPIAFLAGALSGMRPLAIPAVFLVALYIWIWLRFRPGRFAVDRNALEVIWPLKRRRIPRQDISSVRVVDSQALRQEIGWGLRIGAGGLWGGFGWLWTKRRGIIRMYVSRTDRFVWIERENDKPWLITPEQPEAFVRSLSRSAGAPPQVDTNV